MVKTACAVILILYGVVMLMMCYIVIFKTGKELKNRVHFYVARDKNGKLWLYMGKPFRNDRQFYSDSGKGVFILPLCIFEFYLNENDYKDLKWKDKPVEVFIHMED